MRARLKKRVLDGSIPNLIENNLIELFNKIKNTQNPNEKDIKYLVYHAIGYLQYLNLLGVNQAVELYKNYILSDGSANMLIEKFYYLDGNNRMRSNEIKVPLYFDDLLKEVSQYLMKYKDIVNTITKNGYKNYFRDNYHINTSDIIIFRIVKLLEEIKIYSLIALKKHWITINKEILPFLLEKAPVVQTKN